MKFKLWLQNEEGTVAAVSGPSGMGSATTTADVAHYTLPLFATAVRRTSLYPVRRKQRRHSLKKHVKLP